MPANALQHWPWLSTAIAALLLLGVLLARAQGVRQSPKRAAEPARPAERAEPAPNLIRRREPDSSASQGRAAAQGRVSAAQGPAAAQGRAAAQARLASAPSLKVGDDAEDLDVTLVRTSPLSAELAKLKAERAAMSSLPSIATSPVGEEDDFESGREPSRVELMFEDDEAAVEEATSPVARILDQRLAATAIRAARGSRTRTAC